FAVHQYELITNVLIIILKVPLRLVLHLKELADSIFAPTKSAQIVTAAALIELNQEVFVAIADRLQRDRFVRNRHGAILNESADEVISTGSGSDRVAVEFCR